MKKYVLLTTIALLFMCCNIQVRTNTASASHIIEPTESWKDLYISGMHYMMQSCSISDGAGGGHYASIGTTSVTVINVTKDSLECAYYMSKLK